MKIFKEIVKFILIFGITFVIVFSIINFPAVSMDAKYYWNLLFHKQQLNSNNYLPQIKSIIQSTNQSTNQKITQPTIQQENFSNNHIIIKKLGLDVPIVWDSPESDFLKNLQYGVVHYQGTSHPGQGGNIFIAGHSSSYWWERGKYSAIFSVINKLNNGDEIIITYNNKVFVYKVTDKFVVAPNQVNVMANTLTPTLTLMTCTPVGTAINRLIVRAQQVIP
jgi:sortase A